MREKNKDNTKGNHMKILLTTDFYRPTINGVVTSTVNLSEGLRERGHEVRVLTLKQKDNVREDGVWYLPSVGLDAFVAPTVRFRMGFPPSIYSEILDWEPDIVHSQCEFCTFGPAKKIANKLDVPLVNTYHTVYEDYARYLFRFSDRFGRYAAKKFTKERLRLVDAVVAPTVKTRQLLQSYGVETDIYVVPSGLNLGAFRSPEHGEMYRKVKEITAGRRSLLFIGRLAKEKNIGELISFIREMNDPELVLLIGGYGPEGKALEEQAEDLKDRVVFLGTVQPDEVPQCYAAADIFVSASTSETQGLTYFEALASGTPVLCREDPCIHAIVRNGENGYRFTDYESFCTGLKEITAHAGEKMESACRAAAEEYSKETFARRIEEVYIRAIERKNAEESVLYLQNQG